MSSRSNSWIRDACIAAPRAESSEGLMAVADVEGDRIAAGCNRETRLEAIFGMCDVPPESITYVRHQKKSIE